MAKRAFRQPESYELENRSRDAIRPFLESRGFSITEDRRALYGKVQSQVITAESPTGAHVKMRVRLCWRREPGKKFSAAQLRSELVKDDWDLTLQYIVERDLADSITHALIAQRDGDAMTHAAMVPINQLPAIWHKQAAVSDQLISAGKMSRVRKNHARNGSSPTIYLEDTRTPDAHEVPDVLWSWPNVVDLVDMPEIQILSAVVDDTFDDCPHPDPAVLGMATPDKHLVTRSEVKRDPRVRAAVAARANGICERPSCGATRPFPGFLDVHHILGIGTSDHPRNCVAICPNCHREAHYAPDRAVINGTMLEFVEQTYLADGLTRRPKGTWSRR